MLRRAPLRASGLVALGVLLAACTPTPGPSTSPSLSDAPTTTEHGTTPNPTATGEQTTATESAAPESASAEPEPDQTSAEGDLPDPCALLSAADIEAASGVTMSEGVFNELLSNTNQAICDWLPADGSTSPSAQVLVNSAFVDPAAQRDSVEEAFGDTVDADVPGADNPYTSANGAILGMGVGDLFVQVSYLPADASDATEITTALARTVVDGLG